MSRIRDDWSRAWRDGRWPFAAVWLLFLAYPIAELVTSPMGAAARTYGLIALGVFAFGYLLSCVYLIIDFDEPAGSRRWLGIVGFLVLVGIAGALTTILHEEVFALAPYLMALAAFAFPVPVAVAVCVSLMGAAVLLPELIGDWQIDTGIVLMLLVIGPVLLTVRMLRTREELRGEAAAAARRLNEQLAVIGERERVARDVHDILGHSLTVMTVKAELAGRLVDVDTEAAKTEIADLHRISREALAAVRTTVGGLRSPDLDAEFFSARTALTAAQILPELPLDTSVVRVENRILFAWALREAVTNVVRHSGASSCRVTLSPTTICVIDDGVGQAGGGIGNGLRGLRERVEAAGGLLVLESRGGTTVRVTVERGDTD